MSEFKPIPTNTRYEINKRGEVRNANTKQILKPCHHGGRNVFGLYIGKGKSKTLTIHRLLFETFGEKPQKNSFPIRVTLKKADAVYEFQSMWSAANFLSKHEYYSLHYFKNKMTNRESEILGWNIQYDEEVRK